MFEDGAQEFSWEFTVGWLVEAISSYGRGISTSKDLLAACREVEEAVRDFELGLSYGLTIRQVSDELRRIAASDPVGSDSPTGGGSPPR
jgi:hypothetical protein